MFDNLQKISLLSVESLYFSKDLLLFMKHLEKMTLVLTPSPLLKCHFYSHIQIVSFLDVKLNLVDGSFKPYRKNEEVHPVYIHVAGCQVAKSIFAVLFSYSTFYKNYSTFIGKSIQKFSTFGLE